MTDNILTKQALLKSQLTIDEYEIGGMGKARMRELSARGKLAFSESMDPDASATAMMEASVRLALSCVLAEDDLPMFAGEDELDTAVEAIMDGSLDVAEALVSSAMDLMGFGEEAIKEEVANFTEAPSEGTSSQ